MILKTVIDWLTATEFYVENNSIPIPFYSISVLFSSNKSTIDWFYDMNQQKYHEHKLMLKNLIILKLVW